MKYYWLWQCRSLQAILMKKTLKPLTVQKILFFHTFFILFLFNLFWELWALGNMVRAGPGLRRFAGRGFRFHGTAGWRRIESPAFQRLLWCLLFLPCFILLKIKSAPTEVSALKNATPIVAKQILNAKGIPYCHPSGGAFLAKSYRMTSKRVHCTCYYNNTGTPRFAVLRFVWCSYYTARLWQHFAIKIFQKSALFSFFRHAGI